MQNSEAAQSVNSYAASPHNEGQFAMDAKFYVYAHLRATGPRAGSVFYIGKGQGKRAWSIKGRNSWHARTAAKYGFDAILLADGLSEEEAYVLEADAIMAVREHICNLTDGGRGCGSGAAHPLFGVARPAEVKAAISSANKGKVPSDAARAKMRASHGGRAPGNKGVPHSAESRAKMSAASLGRPKSAEHRARIAASNVGKRLSAETREKIGLAHRSKVISEEHRARISSALRGKKQTPEFVAKRMEARRANAAAKASINAS